MNERQKDLLKVLLTEKQQYFLTKQLAEKVNCSEKTVRNDLKVIEQYLQEHTSALLLKKPGLGISLQIDEVDQANLFKQLHIVSQADDEKEQERVIEIAYQLLMEAKHMTLKSLAEQFYIHKNVIKQDLEKIRKWLKKYHLNLVSKQRIGLVVEGSEQNKRMALSNLDQLLNPFQPNRHFIKQQFPPHEVFIVEKELKEMEQLHHLSFTDDSFESILMHILIAIKRNKMNQSISTAAKSSDVRNTNEYKWTKSLLKRLEPFFAIRFSEKEIMHLAIHVLGAKVNSPSKLPEKLKEHPLLKTFLHDLIHGMSRLTNIDFYKDHELSKSLSIHLLSTFQRLAHDLPIANPMVNEIKKTYPYMFDSIISVITEIEQTFPYKIVEEEAAYLTLHFQASYERLQKVSAKDIQVLIVCQMGIGMSQLIQTKLERHFRDIHIVGCIGKADVDDYLGKYSIDLIISTVPLSIKSVPSITVSPLLPESDIKKVKQFIQHRHEHLGECEGEATILAFLNEAAMFLNLNKVHRYEVIEELANALCKAGYVDKQYAHSAIVREKMAATTIGAGIAIPHGDPKHIKNSAIAAATLKQPLEWGAEKVYLVFLIAVKEKQEKTKQLFQELSFLSERPVIVQALLKETNPLKWKEILSYYLKKRFSSN
ncbi:BglG family transcription antiterminator [Bacillus alveayuensis]|uniref:Activator of the mannose operon (Transcriptional antiterminator) n=1 Tax=Aeribacillus alveayuensis TaxID=279215 RepID=A0ABT9VPU1_9BACI|nr:BglG family transcription antiterminator [Bacillus alveayuensis]MDQ0162872.1 activator of the mannose operon (transcriptional antiterminator) [Bacillus alveayuensis]